ncbi:hypothetical protein Sme01_63460 [Sphaerisporangium melleum]|uniref:AAA domain-containing protein n=1 Tax=Sphaerisporangium melleum TaxID=321316 RepID=A0A917RSY5_9ACTN|nr:AAA family ATPase [Sphaerisporangium melleum]GGL21689.1 hypothetical protein GCM10007964_74530 [Sphaerisporangium melleum]GII73870.1 hypothetical protein Sme01_63460 [Sphaerisporangium melleum]
MIVTFYSYKGGVGRTMALANLADLLARSGLRVLMIDFDLEAPGLEHCFPIDHAAVRGGEGLLDLLLAYKYEMSVASSGGPGEPTFRDLGRFTTTVYPERERAGALDLIAAGRRRTDEQVARYGLELRRFDWTDFYRSWSGELFFEWLRREVTEKYDVVLVDSRTGLTETGGVCAYQLADVVVTLCAPNAQNIEGTDAMVRHFLSPEVRAARGDRPLEMVVVPSRVDESDPGRAAEFQRVFVERFARYLPEALARGGMDFWDLRIPYDPGAAFSEGVVTDPAESERRRGLAAAYGGLLTAVAHLAPRWSPVAELAAAEPGGETGFAPEVPGSGRRVRHPVEPSYDPTTRFAAPDVFVLYPPDAADQARHVREVLGSEATSSVVAWRYDQRTPDPLLDRPTADRMMAAGSVVLILVTAGFDPRQWIGMTFPQDGAGVVVPVLLPGADPEWLPAGLRELLWLDFRDGFEEERFVAEVRRVLSASSHGTRVRSRRAYEDDAPPRNPFVGLAPFGEESAADFFGRHAEIAQIIGMLADLRICVISGPAGSGKTSLVQAGVVPALRRGAVPGSERWPVVELDVAALDPDVLLQRLTALLPGAGGSGPALEFHQLVDSLAERFGRVVVVLDPAEELLTLRSTYERRLLLDLITRPALRAVLVPIVVLRSEYLDAAMTDPALGALMTPRAIVWLKPAGEALLREAMEAPAARAGVAFEPGLVDRIVADFGDESVALPFLQFVFSLLWERRTDGYLTHAAYNEMGGLRAVLSGPAENVLAGLEERDRHIARVVLLRLVLLNEDGEPHAVAVVRDDLLRAACAEGYEAADVERVVSVLVAARLLTADAAGVRLAHEALLTRWPRLRGWIDDEQADLRLLSQVEYWARLWEQSERTSVDAWLSDGPLQRLADRRLRVRLSPWALSCLERSERLRRWRRGQFRLILLGPFLLAICIAAAIAAAMGWIAWTLAVVFLVATLVETGVVAARAYVLQP